MSSPPRSSEPPQSEAPPSPLSALPSGLPLSNEPRDTDVPLTNSEAAPPRRGASSRSPSSAGRGRRARGSRGSTPSRRAPSEPSSEPASEVLSEPLDFGSDPVEGTPAPVPRNGSSLGPATPRSGLGTNTSAEYRSRTMIWGTTIDVGQFVKTFRSFLEEFKLDIFQEAIYPQRLLHILDSGVRSLNVDAAHLRAFDSEKGHSNERALYRNVVQYPQETMPLMDSAAQELLEELAAGDPSLPPVTQRVMVRPFNLATATAMRDLNPAHIDTLLSVHGMVTRTSNIIPDLRIAFFECALCSASVEVTIDHAQIDEPATCVQCQGKRCMLIVHNRCLFADKQVVKLQEAPDRIPEGETPQTVTSCCWDDLVDVAKPGDRIVLTGILRAQPIRVNPRQRTCKAIYRTYFDIQHIRKVEAGRLTVEDARADASSEYFTAFDEAGADDEGMRAARQAKVDAIKQRPDAYNALAQALAPSIWELDDVKKGILLQLFAGTSTQLAAGEAGGGTRLRGDLNVLLVGDPGTSKSQLLQYVHKVAPRGVYTSGKGSSAVGLTAYVTKDTETGSFVLESGALVLSDRGVCCIDEFDKMGEGARSVLHEAMEQQTVSIAKAGIICTLNARTSILASANPRESRYNPGLSVIENIDLPPTLLSRFDLIYLLLDKPDERTDRLLARHLVGLYAARPNAGAAAAGVRSGGAATATSAEELAVEGTPIEQRTLTEYISYARQNCHPRLSDEASDELAKAYVEMRRVGASRKTISATPRQLESLIRLSEAHARLHLRPIVEKEDVDEAVRLMRVATQQSATDPLTGTIDMDLIATGRSAAARGHIDQLAAALLDALRDSSTGSATVGALHALILEGAAVQVSFGQVREALDQLKTERSVTERAGTITLAK